MASRIRVGIASTGSYLPERIVPNSEFEKTLDTSDEWIVQRTGIRERRFAAENEATSDLCAEAGRRALAKAGLDATDLDLIIVGTLTPDFMLPSTACIVQNKLGATNAGAFDCAAACTGFLTALHTAEAYVAAGRAKRVLAIGAETLSRFINREDRGSCILFGDGAGAAIVSAHDECKQAEVLKTTLKSDGSGYDFIHIVAGGSRHPTTQATVDERQQFITLRGREVFRFAVTHMSQLIEQMLEGFDREELSLIVPHQVNRRIIDAALDRLGMTDERVMVNIQKYANTSAATVPIALDEAIEQGRIEKDKLVVLVAFGAGLTWGATLLRW